MTSVENRRDSIASKQSQSSLSTIDSHTARCRGLHHAACQGDMAMMTEMLDKLDSTQRVNLINARNRHGMSALHGACFHGRVGVADYLLDNGADVNARTLSVVEVESNAGATPLHFACVHGHARVLRVLLSHGADPTLRDRRNCLPVDIARIHSHHKCERILERFDANRRYSGSDASSSTHSNVVVSNIRKSLVSVISDGFEVEPSPEVVTSTSVEKVKRCWSDHLLPTVFAVKLSDKAFPQGTELARFFTTF